MIFRYILLILMFAFYGCWEKMPEQASLPEVPPSDTASTDTSSFSFEPFDEPPKLIEYQIPHHPRHSTNKDVRGSVILMVEVLESGAVGSVRIRKSLDAGAGGLDEIALKAVKKWKYQPALKDSLPVRAEIVQAIDF